MSSRSCPACCARRSRPTPAPAPLERLGTPGDVADSVAFLAGPGRWVNGQVIYVNGGIV
jgi:NAD(P)-dependent dehydrogenase (short-subunit alcohol dehydrogenase family)